MIDVDALIRRWQEQDERAAEALYNHFRDQVFRLAYGLLGNLADAEEVAQDALGYALLNVRHFDPDRSSFTTWLHTITVSRCRNRYRRRHMISVPVFSWFEEGHDLADPAPTPERLASCTAARNEIWQAVQTLKPQLREAILLRYWAEHTYREMAEILGCPVSTAQSRVRLAFEQLRARLSPGNLAALDEEQVR